MGKNVSRAELLFQEQVGQAKCGTGAPDGALGRPGPGRGDCWERRHCGTLGQPGPRGVLESAESGLVTCPQGSCGAHGGAQGVPAWSQPHPVLSIKCASYELGMVSR